MSEKKRKRRKESDVYETCNQVLPNGERCGEIYMLTDGIHDDTMCPACKIRSRRLARTGPSLKRA